MKQLILTLTAAVWMALATATSALAQYPPTSAPPDPTSAAGGQQPGGGVLPFTGTRLSMWFAILLALVLAGLVLSFLGRRRRSPEAGRVNP